MTNPIKPNKMKTSIFALLIGAFIAFGTFTSCNNSTTTSSESVKSSSSDSVTTSDTTDQTYLDDMKNYRAAVADTIAYNEKEIARLKAEKEYSAKNNKSEYTVKVTVLEKKNGALKQKMEGYKAKSKEDWKKFKAEFSHDMRELGHAFKDLTVKNVK